MALVDMKKEKKKKKKGGTEELFYEEREKWPYGLRLSFETKEIEKLPELLDKKVGDKCVINAIATVIATRRTENQNGPEEYYVELQIEKIEVKSDKIKYSKKMTPEEYKKFRKSNNE